jgi:superfamily II DNA or RNA helicase
MLLRPRQKELVNRAVEALHRHGNTLAVAPTGSGKTVMLSATIGELFKASRIKSCVVAHRDELTAQNQAKFCRVNPHIPTGIFDASVKSWQGDTTFAMVQTLSRETNLASMPRLDLLVIDEAHHARSESYLRVITHAKTLNPNLKLLGMTATPNRGDKKGLRPVFSNVCDRITVNELIASGHLVRPKMFVMDLGMRERLKEVRKTAGDYDMEAVAQIMDTRPINEAVVAHWKKKAGNRQTVVFCSTVEHACHVRQGFRDANVPAVLVHGEMPGVEREQALKAYSTGVVQVIVNVAVLLEGWDHPPTSCIVLLRPSSYKSTFIQMVGRGLRTVNPEEYPGIIKNDCIVLDFGTATLTHGSIEQTANLDDAIKGDAPVKACPECEGEVPAAVFECPLCGFNFESQPKEGTEDTGIEVDEEDFTMTEIDILNRSHFVWIDVDGGKRSFMAAGFNAWSGVFFLDDGQWHAVGGLQREHATLLAVGDKAVCFAAANDWMSLHETDDSAYKAKGWLNLPATEKQLLHLPEYQGEHLTRYKASVLMGRKFNAWKIDKALNSHTLYAGGSR